MICICGNAKEDNTEECEVCGLVYELRQPTTQLEIEAEPPDDFRVEIIED